MKKCILTILATLICLFLFALDITSTAGGGDRRWQNSATWIGGIIPGASDNVTINGLVEVDTNASCNYLINQSTIRNWAYGGGQYSLTINERLENHGTFANYSGGTLTVYLVGDLANYGTLDNHCIYLTNPGQSTLWMDADAPPVYCRYFHSQSDTGTYQALSDLRFSGSNVNINLNNRTLILHQGEQSFGLYLNGGVLTAGILEGGTAGVLHMGSGAHISHLTMDNIIWQGTIQLKESVSVNNLINQGTIQNWTWDGGQFSLTINERLENHGTIANYSGGIVTVNLFGDLANYGTLSNTNFNLSNPGQSTLWQHPAAPPITCANFHAQSDTGTYQALSDLRFSGSNVNLNNRTLILHQGEQSFGLYFNSGVLTAGVLEGVAGSFLHMENGAHISHLMIDNIICQGTIQLKESNIVNNLINQGTIQNWAWDGGQFSLTINERLENHGTIANYSGGIVTVNLFGDLANYGTLSNTNFNLSNPDQITLWQHPDAPPITCANFHAQSDTGTYQALSDLRFSGSNVNLNNRTLILHQGEQSFGLYFNSGVLTAGILEGGAASFLQMGNGANISHLTIDNIIWRGTIQVKESNIVNNLINQGTIQNWVYDSGHYSLTINECLENHGTIANYSGGTLTLYCGKNLSNYGTIQNSAVYINGTENQDIMNVGTITVSNFYLVSEIGTAAWYFNNVLSSSFQNHEQITISVANLGVWQPRNTTGDGRLITIGNVALYLSAPENLSSYLSGSELKLRWNQVPGAIHYNVYYSDRPEGPFTTLLSQVFDNDLSDGFVQADLSGAEPRQFYQVKAGN